MSDTTKILARIRPRLTKNAIQNTAAIMAVTMSRAGDTSQESRSLFAP